MAASRLVLVLTDVAGSTRLWAEHPAAMLGVMRRHHRIVHDAIHAHGGWRPIDQGEGDAVFAAFSSALSAVESVLAFQRALEEEPWPDGLLLRDRVGIDAGEVEEQDGNLFGVAVSRTARIRSLGAGGQVLASGAVLELIGDHLPTGVRATDLGTHRLRDIDEPESIHQLVGPGMLATFPPLAASLGREVALPAPRSSFIGREREVIELAEAVRTDRLVTVTGFGGMGKTRLAVAAAAAAAETDERLGVRFVDLSAVDRPASIGPAIAAALGIDEGIDDPLGSVLRWLRGRRMLLVLDNLEQLMPEVADVVARVLDATPDVGVLATSREPLRLLGERVLSLGPLAMPPQAMAEQRSWTGEDVEALGGLAAVRLLVARAAAARRDFALTPATARAVAGICLRLEGSPLATELVAVRLRVESPQSLLPRLEHALSVVGGGIRDLPARQQTLRATIEWSVRALEPDERRVLWRLSVFPGSFTAEAAELICGAPDGPDVLTGLIALVDRSLVRFHAAERIGDADRFDLLVPIRELATERLLEEEPDGVTLDRHADHFAQAVRLDPDGTREERAALTAVVEAEWHNIRTALNRLHDRGGVAEELALSPMLGRCLQLIGREGTAVSLLRHAADHLDPGDDGDLALTVLTHLADIESGTGRAASAVPTLLRAHRLLERSRSPVPTVHLAALNTSMQDPCDADPALFDHAYEVLAAMPERGNLLPKWYLTELWTLAAVIAGDRRGDPLQARMLESATGRELLHLRCEIGADLSWVGRSAEAEELLAPFTDAGVRGAAYPVDRILPLMVLADIRIAAGRVAEAGDVLDAAAVDLAKFDQPFEHAMIRVQRAAVDRAAGDLDGAAERLEALLGSDDADRMAGATGYARWLLAVVERERGRPVAAAAWLRLAWDVARVASDEELVVGCLLERSAQSVAEQPERALRDLAMATTHPAHVWVHFAVDHDTDAMRARLELRLGAAPVETAVAEAAALDLVLPEWDHGG